MKWLFAKTFNNVWFGIVMMLLVAIYVAVGSGQPRVREYFELDELGFFQAWPLKVLMALLVANLVTVTFVRIPFTVPRYGVWMIHTGIVLLIYGMAYYYSFKQEGLAFVPKGGTAVYFYDQWERSLYVRVDGMNTRDEHVMPSLPRFGVYDETGGVAKQLKGKDLKGIEPVIVFPPGTTGAGSAEKVMSLTEAMGMKGRLNLDVVGYWPYAELVRSYEGGSEGGGTGMRVELRDGRGGLLKQVWLLSSDPEQALQTVPEIGFEMEHRAVETEAVAKEVLAAAARVHAVEITVGGKSDKRFVEVGQAFEVGGYKFQVESFDPAWITMQGERVKLLTLGVTPPADSAMKGEKFRRQLIPGREAVTDWKLGEAGAGPMGKRQTKPLDEALVTRYAFNDTLALLPRGGDATEKRTFVTTPATAAGPGKTWLLETCLSHAANSVELAGGKTELTMGNGETSVKLSIERQEGLSKTEKVVVVPREKRNRTDGEVGRYQLLAVRAGYEEGGKEQWSKLVYVPFTQWTLEAPWKGGVLQIPGTDRVVQLQLGKRTRPIAPDVATGKATVVKLEKFELVSYAGGGPQSGMQRDFKSTLLITEGSGRMRTGTAHMNSPIYFGGTPGLGLGDTYWTLFQAQWDPEGQRFTVLGVGNRPGVWVMTGGCVLMTVGLMYAFYVKPLIIRRMKDKAIEEAKAKGKKVPGEKAVGAAVAVGG